MTSYHCLVCLRYLSLPQLPACLYLGLHSLAAIVWGNIALGNADAWKTEGTEEVMAGESGQYTRLSDAGLVQQQTSRVTSPSVSPH